MPPSASPTIEPYVLRPGENRDLPALKLLLATVIGGLTTSTILTLFVVPVVYTLFDDLGRFFQKKRASASKKESSILEASETKARGGASE